MTKNWEDICNHCGWCCLIKVQDDETDEIYYTKAICKYFDIKNKICTEYQNRCTLVPTCLKLTPDNVDKIPWMPKGCAYRSLFEKAPIPKQQNIQDFCISELLINEDDLEDLIIEE